MDPYLIVHDKCTFVDQQTVKLQEAPDMVPVGELPRHVMLWADRYLTNRVIPGSRIIVTGILSTFQPAKAVRISVLRPRRPEKKLIILVLCRKAQMHLRCG